MSLEVFFKPRSVALLGASRNPIKGGHSILMNIMKKKDEMKLYVINPKADEILGLKCYKSFMDVPDNDIDLAIFFIPPDQILESMDIAIKKGVKAILIESAGFSEVGAVGEDIQQKVRSIAKEHGIRVWGANCMGYLDAETDFTTTFMPIGKYKKENVALISQSGMFLGGLFERLRTEGEIGFSKVFTLGNQIDVSAVDCLKVLKEDSTTDVIGMYLEAIQNPRKFMKIAKETIKKKPIIFIKGGRSVQGKKAARSHTGSISEDVTMFDALAKQAGIIQVNDFMELNKNLKLFSYFLKNKINMPQTNQVSLLTFSGGTGVVFSDLVAKYGLKMAKFSEESINKMENVYPPWMKPGNEVPLDVWPAYERNGRRAFYTCLEEALATPNLSGLVFTVAGIFSDFKREAHDISVLYNKYKKPLVGLQMFGDARRFRKINKLFQDYYIPIYDGVGDAIRCLKNFINYGMKPK